MANLKLNIAAEIIKTGALEFLADKHGLTVTQVVEQIQAGNVNAAEQFRSLVMAGIDKAIALASAGQISLA